jgi:hypothetical protein
MRVVYYKIVILCLGTKLNGPYFWKWNVYFYKTPNSNKIRPTFRVLTRLKSFHPFVRPYILTIYQKNCFRNQEVRIRNGHSRNLEIDFHVHQAFPYIVRVSEYNIVIRRVLYIFMQSIRLLITIHIHYSCYMNIRVPTPREIIKINLPWHNWI